MAYNPELEITGWGESKNSQGVPSARNRPLNESALNLVGADYSPQLDELNDYLRQYYPKQIQLERLGISDNVTWEEYDFTNRLVNLGLIFCEKIENQLTNILKTGFLGNSSLDDIDLMLLTYQQKLSPHLTIGRVDVLAHMGAISMETWDKSVLKLEDTVALYKLPDILKDHSDIEYSVVSKDSLRPILPFLGKVKSQINRQVHLLLNSLAPTQEILFQKANPPGEHSENYYYLWRVEDNARGRTRSLRLKANRP